MSREIVKKLKLQEPVRHGSETIEELEFIKPKARHLRKLPQNPSVGDVLDLAAVLTAQPPSVIDELVWEDVEAVSEVIENLSRGSRGTGNG